jgi:hypothetical protein
MLRGRFRLRVEGALIALGVALIAPPLAAPAVAQGCAGDWSRPVVCTVELSAAVEGERRSVPVGGRTLELPTRSRVEIYADPFDQWGRRFPLERFDLGVEVDRDCDGLVSLELGGPDRGDRGRLLIETGSRTGACDLLLWVPGNLNLDRELRIEVSRGRRAGYTRAEADLLARWLFRAILGRDVDPDGMRASAMEIQRGELRSQVEAMVRSPEFRQRRAGLPAEELLEDVYQGLLGRLPDGSGVRSYLPRVRRGDLAGVVFEVLGSEELDERLDRALK